MATNREITKVKWKGDAVEVHATEALPNGDYKEIILKAVELPDPDFTTAWGDLLKCARQILELLPQQWADDQMAVTGLSFSKSKDGEEGAVITGQVTLRSSEAPFNFNTPHLMLDNVSGTVRNALVAVKHEAEKFLLGKRAQGNLFEHERAVAA